MRKFIAVLMLLVFGTPAALADGAPAMKPEAMLKMVQDFYRLSREVDRRGMAAVEDIMALVHDDARYIHTEYASEYDKAAWIDGYKRRIARAHTEREGETVITNHIAGKNILITERTARWSDMEGGQRVHHEKTGMVATYQFKGGKLWRIKEYWE
ncbi:hypothetical protein [Kordiimonas marina]|uniref:hypothetical protein n=1 Tax=Kordiimonas marina TaxID=2872312 RepID=UPI001FF52603|nr:hypothetical protein [Kordiimonas marina]MCJ9429214.1 hypothetical protein [Kordiimonas marina]